jgi:hypothetical protein
MSDLQWSFWIPFDPTFSEHGGVGVTVGAEGIDDAIDGANRRAIQAMELLDADAGGVGVFFATDYPFGRNNLATVECCLDGEGVDRLDGEPTDDFLPRVGRFVGAHPTEGDHEDE